MEVYNESAMEKSLKQRFLDRTQKNYARLSGVYDLLAGGSELNITRHALEMIGKNEHSKILDIGCGTGSACKELLQNKRTPDLLVGADLAFPMCGVAKQKLEGDKSGSNATIINANALNLPFSPNTFDAILMSFTLELFPGDLISVVLRECERLMTRDGRLYIVHMAESESLSLMSKLYRFFHRQFPSVIDCRPMNMDGPLEAAGFEISNRMEMSFWGLPVGIKTTEMRWRSNG